MADGYGGIVAGSWRCHCAAWVVSQNDRQATIRVEARFQAVNGWHFTINGINGSVKCDGQSGSGTGNANVGTNGETTIYRRDFTVNKTDSARSVGCSATVSQSAFNAGSSTASCSVSVGGIPYKKPNPPKNVSYTRDGDTAVMARWQGNWDNNALKPWKQVQLWIRGSTDTNGGWGAWQRRATVNWDVTSYRFTGLRDNARYQFGCFATNQAGESTHVDSAPIYTKPAAPKSVSVVKKSETQILVSVDVSNSYAYTVNLQRFVNGKQDTTFGTKAVSVNNKKATYTDNSLPAGDISYKAQSTRPVYDNNTGSTVLYSAYTPSGTVTTIQKPLAPTITQPATGSTMPVGTSVTVSWTPNHPDRTAQSAAQMELTLPDGTVRTVNVSGATTSSTVTDSVKGAYKARVRTKGLHADWGDWSAYVTWKEALPPDIVILEPSEVTASPFTISWSVADETGVSQQTIEIKTAGRLALSRSVPSSTRSLVVTPSDFLPENGDELLVTVKVRGGSSLAAEESTLATVEYTPPARPEVTVIVSEGYAAMVKVDFRRTNPGSIQQAFWTRAQGEPGKSPSLLADFYTVSLGEPGKSPSVLVPLSEGKWLPETDHATLERILPDGSVQFVADNLHDGDVALDRLPPLNVDYEYRVTAFTSANSSDSTTVTARLETDRPVFNFGDAAEECLPVGGAWKVSEKPDIDTAEYHFADDMGLPMSYESGNLDNKVSVSSAYLYEPDLHRMIRSYARTRAKGWLRLVDGSRLRCKVTMSQSLAAHGQMVDFTADCTELRWEESFDG